MLTQGIVVGLGPRPQTSLAGKGSPNIFHFSGDRALLSFTINYQSYRVACLKGTVEAGTITIAIYNVYPRFFPHSVKDGLLNLSAQSSQNYSF